MAFWGDNFRRGVFSLRVVSPTGAARVLSLDKPVLKIGRARDNDLVLDDPCVADHHCRLLVRDGALELRDHGSRFGTTINHRRCSEPTRIAEGDRIGVGAYLLERIPARLQADIDDLPRRFRHDRDAWREGADEKLRRDLDQAAAAWHALARPRRLLPDDPLLVRAAELAARVSLAAPTRAWLLVAAARRRRRQGLRWALAGTCLGLVLAARILHDLPADEPPPPPPAIARPEIVDAGPAAPLALHTHRVLPGETLAQIASVYGVTPRALEQWNHLTPGAPLVVGSVLHVEATRAPLTRSEVVHEVQPGDTWETLAHHYGVSPARLRADNPRLEDTLHAGERLTFWAAIDHKPPPTYTRADLEVPPDGISLGGTGDGGLKDSVVIPRSRDYDLRCPYNAHAASYTADRLLTAIAAFRVHYRGQIVIGDLSRNDGGSFGRHASHQSGRDVDIWLPSRARFYRTSDECELCNTHWCRPEPSEVDWPATWALVTALRDTGAVQNIFLDRSLHDELRAAATAAGLSDEEALRAVPLRAVPGALVTHASNHKKHIHVRFRCGPGDDECRK